MKKLVRNGKLYISTSIDARTHDDGSGSLATSGINAGMETDTATAAAGYPIT